MIKVLKHEKIIGPKLLYYKEKKTFSVQLKDKSWKYTHYKVMDILLPSLTLTNNPKITSTRINE